MIKSITLLALSGYISPVLPSKIIHSTIQINKINPSHLSNQYQTDIEMLLTKERIIDDPNRVDKLLKDH
jgi:hypothetical protein